MKRIISVALVLTAVAISGAAWWAIAGGKGDASKKASSCDPAACEVGEKPAVASKSAGKVLGNFDLAMTGCRFACATKVDYDKKSVIAQPGAKAGKLTQCPVSGVVFSVDAKRPMIKVGRDEYVTCCGACAAKLIENPSRFVRT